jgi:hypothetical protein
MSDRGGPFCQKGLPGPSSNTPIIYSPCLLTGKAEAQSLARPHPFGPTTGLPTGETVCNNEEFLNGVAGGNFLQKAAPGLPSNDVDTRLRSKEEESGEPLL